VEKSGDLSAPLLELKQRLPDLKGVAAAVAEAEQPISIAAQAEEERPEVVHRGAKKSIKPRTGKGRRKV
jgi:hypothetical protein